MKIMCTVIIEILIRGHIEVNINISEMEETGEVILRYGRLLSSVTLSEDSGQ